MIREVEDERSTIKSQQVKEKVQFNQYRKFPLIECQFQSCQCKNKVTKN